jgi:hypothetical protein
MTVQASNEDPPGSPCGIWGKEACKIVTRRILVTGQPNVHFYVLDGMDLKKGQVDWTTNFVLASDGRLYKFNVGACLD